MLSSFTYISYDDFGNRSTTFKTYTASDDLFIVHDLNKSMYLVDIPGGFFLRHGYCGCTKAYVFNHFNIELVCVFHNFSLM